MIWWPLNKYRVLAARQKGSPTKGQWANLGDVGLTIAADLDKSGATNLDNDMVHKKTKKH